MLYRGYEIRKEAFPNMVDPAHEGWSIYDGETRRKANFGSVELCKKWIDVMIKWSMWIPQKEDGANE